MDLLQVSFRYESMAQHCRGKNFFEMLNNTWKASDFHFKAQNSL